MGGDYGQNCFLCTLALTLRGTEGPNQGCKCPRDISLDYSNALYGPAYGEAPCLATKGRVWIDEINKQTNKDPALPRSSRGCAGTLPPLFLPNKERLSWSNVTLQSSWLTRYLKVQVTALVNRYWEHMSAEGDIKTAHCSCHEREILGLICSEWSCWVARATDRHYRPVFLKPFTINWLRPQNYCLGLSRQWYGLLPLRLYPSADCRNLPFPSRIWSLIGKQTVAVR